MDRIAEWRPVEPAGPDGAGDSDTDEVPPAAGKAPHGNGANHRLLGTALVVISVAVCAVAAAISFVVLAGAPKPAVAIDSQDSAHATGPAASGAIEPSAPVGEVIVDVEGAVSESGLFRLALGSRVGDAIAAAGGYSAQVDIAAATSGLNLAQVLVDGQQVHVPLRGEVAATPVAAAASQKPAAGGGLVDINTATAEELDTLPGIGPVTAAKIIAARQETPFATIDDLSQRGVVGAATLEKIRALIAVGP
jgi:competence protein ComEA